MERPWRGTVTSVGRHANGRHPGASAEQDTDPATSYPRFHAAVALAQLTRWLAYLGPRSAVLDISGPAARVAEVAAGAGHSVLSFIHSGSSRRFGIG